MSLQPYRDPKPSARIIQVMGHVNRFVILPGLIKLADIDFPAADLDRIRQAVNPSTAAFVAPAHPEYLTDWMIDKELQRRVSPMMAGWAASEIVNSSPLAQRFWLANGLIANVPGAGGKAYSVRHARQGHGVLLHPEGGVNWQAEHIWPLHPGAIDMAVTLAQQLGADDDPRPVYVVPLVWRLRFTGNVHHALVEEMRYIERQLSLTTWPSSNPAERLAQLLGALLTRRAHALGLRRPAFDPTQPGAEYFPAQQQIVTEIRARLAATYGPLSDDPMHALRAVQRGMRRRAQADPDRIAQDRELLMELLRLSRLDESLYGRDTLSQEQIAEVLKATRAVSVTEGFRNQLHNLMPRAVARRVAHIRVAEPIDIRGALASGSTSSVLLRELRHRLQRAQDDLGAELEPMVSPHRLCNVMATERNGYAAAV